MKFLSSTQKSYLAGFLDGDGSIYVRLKPNATYRFGYQIAPYIVLFQSAKSRKEFEVLCSLIGFGYIRKRKDGVLEYTIGTREGIIKFLSIVKPYVILKRKQVDLMLKILDVKSRAHDRKNFEVLMRLINSFQELNYSKKRKIRTLTP